ncbi:hypothetical protein TRAPUB_14397, partial [Trametes pubescens]
GLGSSEVELGRKHAQARWRERVGIVRVPTNGDVREHLERMRLGSTRHASSGHLSMSGAGGRRVRVDNAGAVD